MLWGLDDILDCCRTYNLPVRYVEPVKGLSVMDANKWIVADGFIVVKFCESPGSIGWFAKMRVMGYHDQTDSGYEEYVYSSDPISLIVEAIAIRDLVLECRGEIN